MAVHLYVEGKQPATRWHDHSAEEATGKPCVIEWSPFKRLRCCNCKRMRLARNCAVQVYYDRLVISCADKTDCKPRRR